MTTSDECPPIGSTARRKAVSGSGAVSSLGHVEEAMRPMPDQGGRRISAQHGVGDLLAANQSIVGELSLPLVLRRIVEAAAKVVGARYAALGVLGPDGLLEQFVHTGMDEETVRRIGHLPQGHGVLGAVIAQREPIRLDRIADDPRSSGFPPGHPPMDSFVGVPIRGRDVVYGNLYLTDRRDGESFTDEDVDLVEALAATASIAIENARRYEESGRRQQWLQASSIVTRELLSGTGHRPGRSRAHLAERAAARRGGRRHRRAADHRSWPAGDCGGDRPGRPGTDRFPVPGPTHPGCAGDGRRAGHPARRG